MQGCWLILDRSSNSTKIVGWVEQGETQRNLVLLVSIAFNTLFDLFRLIESNSLSSCCFGCAWSVGIAHPTFYNYFTTTYLNSSELICWNRKTVMEN